VSVVVGTLTIDLKANTASFASSMDKMSQLSARTANDVKRSLEKIAAVGIAMGAAIAAGTTEMIKKSLESADALGKLAQKTGTTAETLSVLGYAAKLADVDTETLGKGLEKLSLAMFKAQNGNVLMQNIFARLGVSTKDANGHLKDSGIVMEDLAVKFSHMADGSGKTALAMAIFGRGGAAMIPMLNELGEHQSEINDEAHRFGLVLTKSTTEAADEANDKLKKLGSMFTGLGYSLMSATLPALDELLQKLIAISETADLQGLARAFGGEVVKAVHLLGDALDFAVEHAHALKDALEAIAAIKLASIAIPIVADLAGGGIGNVGKGLDKATLGMLGFERAATALPKIGTWLTGLTTGAYGAAKGVGVAEIAAVGLESGFGRLGKAAVAAITSLKAISVASIFGSLTGGIGKVIASLKAISAASVFAALASGLRAIPALFTTIAAAAANAGRAMLLAALSNPWTAAALAIAGLVALLYTFRDATFSLGGSTYELRDTWNAAWILMKNTVGGVVDWFKKQMEEIKDAWSGVVKWFRENPIGNFIATDLSDANTRLDGYVSRIAKWAVGGGKIQAALDQAKREREGDKWSGYTMGGNRPDKQDFGPPKHGGDQPDTSGLGPQKKDVVGEELRKLDLAIAQQKAYLGVLAATPDKIAEVAAQEKARAIILELTNKLIDQGRLKPGQSLPAAQQAAIQQKVASEESLKSLVEYGRGLEEQQRAADLSIKQTRAMAAANLEGDVAIREATISNALLALSYNKTTEEQKKFLEMQPQLRAMFEERASGEQVATITKEIDGLRDELTQRKMVNAAILDSIDVQRQAALDSKLNKLDENIADPGTSTAARNAMRAQRDELVQLAKAEYDAADAQSALSLRSPVEQLNAERDALNHATDALRTLQGGTLSYEQELGIAARQQDEFNKATDETINLLLREGSMGDGVKAFFLKMQEEAKSAATQIYEVMNETFNKLSTNLTDLLTAPNRQARKEAINQFSTMFADMGKNLLDNAIKSQMQTGLGLLGKAFGVTMPGNKPDGTTAQLALWVRSADAAPGSGSGSGIVGTLLGGGASSGSSGSSSGGGGILGSLFGLLGGGGSSGDTSGGGGGSQSGGGGIIGGLLGSLGGLFGMTTSAAKKRAAPSSPQPTPSSPQLSSAGPASPQPSATPSLQSIPTMLRAASTGTGKNELQNLAASTSSQPSTPQPSPSTPEATPEQPSPSTPQPSPFSLPSMLRQSAAGAVLGASLLGLPAAAQPPSSTDHPAPATVLPAQQPFYTPTQPSPVAGATPGMAAATVTPIGNPPDVQPKDFTQVTQNQPSLFDKILGAGVGLAGQIGGSLVGGAITGGGASGASTASSNASSGAWAQAASPNDNLNDAGIVTQPMMKFGGKVFGQGSGTSDSIPAMLSHGEYVINAKSTSKHLPLLHKINQGFADGGMVGMPGYDDGGFVQPSMAYTPGERGTGEMASASTQVANTSAQSTPGAAGDTHTWHIDARGNSDPAQSMAQTARMMKIAAPQIAASAVHAYKDQQLRRPSSAK
jgi:hypothetical protein